MSKRKTMFNRLRRNPVDFAVHQADQMRRLSGAKLRSYAGGTGGLAEMATAELQRRHPGKKVRYKYVMDDATLAMLARREREEERIASAKYRYFHPGRNV